MVSNFRIFFYILKIPTMSLTPLSQTPQVQLPPQSLARPCHWYTAESDLAVCLKPQNKKIELSIRLFLRNRNHIGKIPLLTCQSVPRGVSWAKNCGGRGSGVKISWHSPFKSIDDCKKHLQLPVVDVGTGWDQVTAGQRLVKRRVVTSAHTKIYNKIIMWLEKLCFRAFVINM